MKTKKADIPYCGVDEKKILEATPVLDWDSVYHFKTFVIGRYRIHKKKDVERLPAPWTNNPVLREFKFTNVRREHDRQTRYLLENITHNPDLMLEDKIVNSFMFRAWNNWDTLRDFGFPYSAEELYDQNLKEIIRPVFQSLQKVHQDRLWYNNAYNQGGTKQAWKRVNSESPIEKDMPLRPFHIGVWLKEQKIVDQLLKAKDQLEAFNIIKTVRGFADFLAYQVFVDLTYIEEFPFSENEFTVAGPGCKKGLDYIFIDKDGMTYEECIFWLRDNIDGGSCIFDDGELDFYESDKLYPHKSYLPGKLFNDLPKYDRCMNVMSLENCMCELSKYIRTVRGEGRPRNRYKPTKED